MGGAAKDTPLAEGAHVVLHGLSSPDKNGKRGVISGPQRQNGRWPVLLEDALDSFAVKEANLHVHAPNAAFTVMQTDKGTAAPRRLPAAHACWYWRGRALRLVCFQVLPMPPMPCRQGNPPVPGAAQFPSINR